MYILCDKIVTITVTSRVRTQDDSNIFFDGISTCPVDTQKNFDDTLASKLYPICMYVYWLVKAPRMQNVR